MSITEYKKKYIKQNLMTFSPIKLNPLTLEIAAFPFQQNKTQKNSHTH